MRKNNYFIKIKYVQIMLKKTCLPFMACFLLLNYFLQFLSEVNIWIDRW